MKIESLRKKIKKSYRRTKNWRKTAKEFEITSGMAYRIAVDGYEPKDPHIRFILDLPALIPAPACPHCGEVHISHRCPYKRQYKNLYDMPIRLLKKILDERS